MRKLLVALALPAVLVTAGCGTDSSGTQSGSPSTATPSTAPASTSPASTESSGSSGPVPTDVSDGSAAPVSLTVDVVETLPHDPSAFTQGLVFDDGGRLFESTGLVGSSQLRELDPDTGEVIRSEPNDSSVFAEGLAVGPDSLVQLTWTDGVAYRWDPDTFELDETEELDDEGDEGWGLTFDGDEFIQSDGSDTLYFRDPDNFDVTDTVTVTRAGSEVDELNELEWVDGHVFANVWHSDEILRIDPTTGAVDAVIDASTLWRSGDRQSEMTLNGIAHRRGDPADRLWLTGKNWPEMFVVDLVPA